MLKIITDKNPDYLKCWEMLEEFNGTLLFIPNGQLCCLYVYDQTNSNRFKLELTFYRNLDLNWIFQDGRLWIFDGNWNKSVTIPITKQLLQTKGFGTTTKITDGLPDPYLNPEAYKTLIHNIFA